MKKLFFIFFLLPALFTVNAEAPRSIRGTIAIEIASSCEKQQLKALERGMNEIAQCNKPTESCIKIAHLIDSEEVKFEQCIAKKIEKQIEFDRSLLQAISKLWFMGMVILTFTCPKVP